MFNKKNSIKEKPSIFRGLTFIFFVLYTITIIFMFSWAFINSFKTDIEFYISVWNLPEFFSIDNYLIAIENFEVQVTDTIHGATMIGFFRMCLNSILYALGCAIAQITTILITSYLTAKFDYKYSKILYGVCFVCLILPIIGNTPSQLMFARFFKLYDSIVGMWILKANFLSTYYLIFHAFFRSVPDAYFEAAKIDGANNFQMLIRIAFPFASKLFMTLVILVFIGIWNDYETPNMWLPNHPVVAVGLLQYNQSTAPAISSTPMKLAGSLIVSVPAFLVFFIFRNTLIGNISNGGLKE